LPPAPNLYGINNLARIPPSFSRTIPVLKKQVRTLNSSAFLADFSISLQRETINKFSFSFDGSDFSVNFSSRLGGLN
jgi:hypothetical protein